MSIAFVPTNRIQQVQCENNAPLPPTTLIAQSSYDYAWRASDFVEYEQQLVRQRLEEKQLKLHQFKQTIKTRVRETEAVRRKGLVQKEIAVEESIKHRTQQSFHRANLIRPGSAGFGPIPTTPVPGRKGTRCDEDEPYIEIEQAEVHVVDIDGDGFEIEEREQFHMGRDVVDPVRLFAGVRTAAMNDERERVRRTVQAKAETQIRLQQEAVEREEGELEAIQREERLRREEEERMMRQEKEERRVKAIAEASRRAELRAKAKEAETLRYAEALHQQFKERIESKNLEIVPLCPCSSTPLDHNPADCFLNCIYYNNQQAYRAALNNLLEELDVEPISV